VVGGGGGGGGWTEVEVEVGPRWRWRQGRIVKISKVRAFGECSKVATDSQCVPFPKYHLLLHLLFTLM
jgi:hypothetical protein